MRRIEILMALLGVCSCAPAGPNSKAMPQNESAPEAPNVLPPAALNWTALNPARGDASPRAATLWGDRTGEGASGFLVKFVDGFESPPHIHNVSYRGIVIDGSVFNEDVEDPRVWMSAGSYWTQPAGDPHVTASRGASMVYVEIDEGPYLVRPVDQAFDNGERPLNLGESEIQWDSAESVGWSRAPSGLKVAQLWETDGGSGRLVRFEQLGQFELSSASPFGIVVVTGRATVGAVVEAGGFIGATRAQIRVDASTTLYLRASARVELRSLP